MRSPWRACGRRRAAWVALILAVLAAHALLAGRLVGAAVGWNSAPRPRPIEVSFTKRLVPTAPPPAVAPALAGPRAPRVPRVARASSAPAPASAPARAPRESAGDAPARAHARLEEEALALAAALERADTTRAQAAAASAARAERVAAAASAASAARPAEAGASVAGPARPPFAWPPATRLTYTLTGEHGAGRHLYGHATVDWRHEGARYQVQFDVHITPMIEQHMASDGTTEADGLRPRHYDEAFSFLLSTPRERRIEFGDDMVTLNNGRRVPRLPQTQDGASQFVQFVWMFYNHPDWLVPGRVVQIPLALPNNLRRWNYQVVGTEPLDLPFGKLDAVHLKPLLDGPRRPNEYPFDIWTAPSLQYLPVQILVRVDVHSWALLALDDLPLQAAGDRPAAPPPDVQPFPPPPPVGER